MLDKKAQIGETLTWVVATIIILVMLVVSIYISSFLAKSRDLKLTAKEVISSSDKIKYDLVMEKSLFVYFSNSEYSLQIYDFLKQKEFEDMFYAEVDERRTELEKNLEK